MKCGLVIAGLGCQAAALISCQTTASIEQRDVLTRGPGAELPKCTVWQAGPLEAGYGCRIDRVEDLDGDRVLDCWRVVPSWTDIKLWLWRGCTGSAAELTVERHAVMAVPLPAGLAVPPWPHTIASILAGTERVTCEKPIGECEAPSAAMQWYLSAAPTTAHRYTPQWQLGIPTLPAIEATVLDSARTCETNRDDLPGPFCGARLLVLDPTRKEHDTQRATLGDYATGSAFKQLAQCDTWTVWSSESMTAVYDRATNRHSWILVRGDGKPTSDAACKDGVVFIPSWSGVDIENYYVVNPVTGFADRIVRDWVGDMHQEVGSGYIRSARLSTQQLREALAPQRDPATPCEVGAGVPLLGVTPDGPCTLVERDDIDGDGTADCIKSMHAGNKQVGTLAWDLEIARGCGDQSQSIHVDHNGVVQRVDVGDLDPATLRWIGKRLAGGLTCVPATRDCPAPDPALDWIITRLNGGDENAGRIAPRWRDGSPTASQQSVALVTALHGIEGPQLVVYSPTAASLGSGDFAPRATCKDLEIWSSPAAGAVVDTKTKRWSWVFVVGPTSLVTNAAGWLDGIHKAWCEDDVAYFELTGLDDHVVATSPRSGRWYVMDVKAWSELEQAPDRVLRIRRMFVK